MTEPSLERIGRYEIIRILGEGSMGRVLLARDPSLDRLVAIKTIRMVGLPAARVQSYLARFQNEARAAARLRHPNVVQVHDFGEDGDVGPYLVFEYVPGRSLADLLEPGGARKIEDVVRIANGIAAGLDVAHAAGIVHRDVKPDNVLVAQDGTAKLADFGVARVPDAAMTQEGQFLGTPSYAAPEALGRGRYTPQSDLFSLAAVVYTVLTGERPFPGDGIAEVSHRVIHEEPRPPASLRPDLPEAVVAVLLRGLAKDPSKRFDSCGEFARAFEAAAGGGSAPRVPGDPSRRVQVVGLTVALGLVASGWIALTYTIGRGAGAAATDAGVDAAPVLVDGEERVAAPSIRAVRPPVTDTARDEDDDEDDDEEVDDAGPPAVDAGGDDAGSSKRNEERVKSLMDEAKRLRASGDTAGALGRVEQVLRLDPEHPEASRMRDALRPPAPAEGASPSSPDHSQTP